MTTSALNPRACIERLQTAASRFERSFAFMEVCGTHTVSAFRCGLHSLMPANVRLISGPGCPVCVTSQADIDQILHLADQPSVTLCTYGDMLRVTGSRGASLEKAHTNGSDVRVIYSSLDAVQVAASEPSRQVVFAAVGFETTTPATAAAVLEAQRRRLPNFTVYASHKRIMPAMLALLGSGEVHIDGFLCPGHVAVIIGAQPFSRIVREHHRGCAIMGFEDFQIAEGLAVLTEMAAARHPKLVNLYPQAVAPYGNRRACNLIRYVFQPVDAEWRGLGVLPRSGLQLRRAFRQFDARRRFELAVAPPGEPSPCRCGDVITGRCTPDNCPLFARVCTPIDPVGPCMVSSEGTCQAWFRYGRERPFVNAGRAAEAMS